MLAFVFFLLLHFYLRYIDIGTVRANGFELMGTVMQNRPHSLNPFVRTLKLNNERSIMPENLDKAAHFKGKDAVGHVVEAQAQGLMASAEVHGTEIPGHISAGADGARETAILLLLLWTTLAHLHTPLFTIVLFLTLFSFGWAIWKCGRSAWLGWSRLERLHRVLEQERWEIEHHRQQEREELGALYAAKGFEGKLLEDILDVLMADKDRTLRVMVQEELGLSLEAHEHPLKQSVGALVGIILAAIACIISLLGSSPVGIIYGAAIVLGIAATISAKYEGNRVIPAIVWNLGIGALSFGSLYFLFEYFFPEG